MHADRRRPSGGGNDIGVEAADVGFQEVGGMLALAGLERGQNRVVVSSQAVPDAGPAVFPGSGIAVTAARNGIRTDSRMAQVTSDIRRLPPASAIATWKSMSS